MRSLLAVCLAGGVVAAAVATDAPRAVHSALILQGVDAIWAHRPHRLRVLGAGLDVFGVEVGAQPKGELWLAMEGGSWADGTKGTDIPDVHLLYAGLSTVSRPILLGSEVLHVTGHAPRAPNQRQPGVALRTVRVPRPAGAGEAAAVWLTGFRFATTDEHPDGFTTHALAVQLGAPVAEADSYRFDISALVEAAPVPDRAQDLGTYSAIVQVDWALVPGETDDISRQDVSARLRRGIAMAGDAERIQPEAIPLHWAAPRGREIVAGLSGFSLDLEEEGLLDGRYLRAFTVGIGDERQDPVAGSWQGAVLLRFANQGQVTRPIAVNASATVTLLALLPGERAWTGRWDPPMERPARLTGTYPELPQGR